MKIKDMLETKNPFKSKGSKCAQVTCPLCTSSQFVEGNPEDNQLPCNTNNVGYRWRCLKCKEMDIVKVYEGESGRSARVRGLEHVKQLENKSKDSPLFKHIQKEHSHDTGVKFKMEITSKFKDALSRQANEAVRINNRLSYQLLNSKSEFNHPPLARVVVERKAPH